MKKKTLQQTTQKQNADENTSEDGNLAFSLASSQSNSQQNQLSQQPVHQSQVERVRYLLFCFRSLQIRFFAQLNQIF